MQKILCSATLSLDPSGISALNLRNPLMFTYSSASKISMPSNLIEEYVVCKKIDKPLHLRNLLVNTESALVFTSSVENSHRLCRLLELYGDLSVSEFSGSIPQQRRSKILSDFADKKIKILICSDAMARGLDVAVSLVINYDYPSLLNTYVHRVGRTARAGKSGRAITLTLWSQVRFLLDMLKKADSCIQQRESIIQWPDPVYQKSLQVLESVINMEATHEILPFLPLQKSLIESLMFNLDNENAVATEQETDAVMKPPSYSRALSSKKQRIT